MTGTDTYGQAKTMRGIAVVPIDTPTLGDRSYVVHDGEVAFVVDPQRDIDRVLPVLERAGVRITTSSRPTSTTTT
jgi:hypothetical protein